MFKKLLAVLSAIMITMMPVAAAQNGRVTIHVDSGEAMRFNVTKAADYINGEFIVTDPYKGLDIDFNEIDTAQEVREATRKMARLAVAGDTLRLDSQGESSVTLDQGLWLFTASGDKYDIEPFLVSMPDYDDNGEVWDQVIEPKVTEVPKETVKPTVNRTVHSARHTGLAASAVSALLCLAGIWALLLWQKKSR